MVQPTFLQGKDEEAEPLYRRAMNITKETLGSDHPEFSGRLDNMAGLLADQVRAEISAANVGSFVAHMHGLRVTV